MKFQEQYKVYQNLIEKKLDDYLQTKQPSENLASSMRYSLLLGGKRIRPVLTLATCELFDQSANVALPAACALEMIHTYSLIHDDLPSMDDDDLRRGKPTNHKVFGEAVAILAGDGLLTEAFTCLSDPHWTIPDQQKIKIVRTISDAAGAMGMVGGQALDLEFEGKDCNERELEAIHIHKTGRLITASLVAGGHAGQADAEQINKLEQIGKKIGLAFQIADDVLDLTATTEELGKNAKSDLKKKKSTYPSLIGLERSKEKAQLLLDESIQLLSTFGVKSWFLKELAELIVHRKS